MVLKIVDSRKRHIDNKGPTPSCSKRWQHRRQRHPCGASWSCGRWMRKICTTCSSRTWPASLKKSKTHLHAQIRKTTQSAHDSIYPLFRSLFKKPNWLTAMQTFPFGWAFYHDSSDNINKLQNCPICTDATLGGYGEAILLSWLTFIGLWSLLLGFIFITFFFENRNSKRGGMATHAGVALELGIKRPSSSSGGIKMMSPQMEAILIWCQCRTRNYVNRII